MPIEKILARVMAILAAVFLLLTLTFYPSKYAVAPALFLLVFITADLILPKNSARQEKKWERILSRVLVFLLFIAVMLCFGSLLVMWKMGHFSRLD